MSNITIVNLNPAGSSLFEDSESFLTELTDESIYIYAGYRSILMTSLHSLTCPSTGPSGFISSDLLG